MIKFVLVDVDDTIFDFSKCSFDAISKLFAMNGLDFDEKTAEVYHSVCNPLWARVEKRKITSEELRKMRWGLVLQRLGIEMDCSDFEESYTRFLSDTRFEVDGAAEMLSYLSGKYKVCIASNASLLQQRKRLTDSGLIKYVDCIFASDELGADKPGIQFFSQCLKRLSNPDGDEVVIIGDSLSADVTGGKNAGIKTCWYNPHGLDNKGIVPDFEISSLYSIPDIL